MGMKQSTATTFFHWLQYSISSLWSDLYKGPVVQVVQDKNPDMVVARPVVVKQHLQVVSHPSHSVGTRGPGEFLNL